MLNSSNQNPNAIWVTSPDGSIRFDANPILKFLQNDEIEIKNGELKRRTKKTADSFSLYLAEMKDGELPFEKEMSVPLLQFMFVMRDICQTMKCHEQ